MVLRGVAGADDEQPLALELQRVPEIMGVQHAAGEAVDALEARHVRDREVAGGHDHVVELLLAVRLRLQIRRAHREPAGRLESTGRPGPRCRTARACARPISPPGRGCVVVEDRVGREGRYGLAEMLFERIVPELQRLLRPVRPQVPVHAAMHRLARARRGPSAKCSATGRPSRTAARSTPASGTSAPLGLCLPEGAKLRKAAGSRSDDGHTFVHRLLPVPVSRDCRHCSPGSGMGHVRRDPCPNRDKRLDMKPAGRLRPKPRRRRCSSYRPHEIEDRSPRPTRYEPAHCARRG